MDMNCDLGPKELDKSILDMKSQLKYGFNGFARHYVIVDWTFNGFAMDLLDTILATHNEIRLPRQPTKF